MKSAVSVDFFIDRDDRFDKQFSEFAFFMRYQLLNIAPYFRLYYYGLVACFITSRVLKRINLNVIALNPINLHFF